MDEGDAAAEARSDFVNMVLSAEPDDVGNVERLLRGAVDFRASFLRTWVIFLFRVVYP